MILYYFSYNKGVRTIFWVHATNQFCCDDHNSVWNACELHSQLGFRMMLNWFHQAELEPVQKMNNVTVMPVRGLSPPLDCVQSWQQPALRRSTA